MPLSGSSKTPEEITADVAQRELAATGGELTVQRNALAVLRDEQHAHDAELETLGEGLLANDHDAQRRLHELTARQIERTAKTRAIEARIAGLEAQQAKQKQKFDAATEAWASIQIAESRRASSEHLKREVGEFNSMFEACLLKLGDVCAAADECQVVGAQKDLDALHLEGGGPYFAFEKLHLPVTGWGREWNFKFKPLKRRP